LSKIEPPDPYTSSGWELHPQTPTLTLFRQRTLVNCTSVYDFVHYVLRFEAICDLENLAKGAPTSFLGGGGLGWPWSGSERTGSNVWVIWSSRDLNLIPPVSEADLYHLAGTVKLFILKI